MSSAGENNYPWPREGLRLFFLLGFFECLPGRLRCCFFL